MTLSPQFTWDSTPSLKALMANPANARRAVARGYAAGLKKSGDAMRRQIRENALKAFKRRPNEIMNGAHFAVEGNALRVWVDAVYAAAHEFGTVIRAFRSKYLAIPLTREAKAYEPRKFPRLLTLFVSRMGSLLLVSRNSVRMRKSGGRSLSTIGNDIVPQYLLRRWVKLRKRPYFMSAVRRETKVVANHVYAAIVRELGVR